MRLLKIIIAPRRTARELIDEKSLLWPLIIVITLGVLSSASFLVSHLQHKYPPPKEMIDAWGEFAMLPFFKLPTESYRLFLAGIMVPFLLAIWILMAGSARLLSILFSGKVSYRQYLTLFAHSFFSFYLIASILDMIYSGYMEGLILRALRGEFGSIVRQAFVLYPTLFWISSLGLAGLYNGIVCQEAEGWSWRKSVAVAVATFIWPVVLIPITLR